MKPSTKRVLSIALAGLFLIGAIFVYSRLITQEFGAIDEKRGSVAAKEELFNNQKTAVDQVKNVITQSQGMESIRGTVSLALPEGTDTTGILHQLNAIANINQVTFNSLTIETPLVQKQKDFLIKELGIVRVQMAVFGSYESLKNFVKGVETNVRVANIENLEIRPLSVGGGELYALNMKVEFFYQTAVLGGQK